MGAPNNIEGVLAGAKKALANANKFTQSVEGNPTSSFAPKKIQSPHIPQVHEHSEAPYALAREARAKSDNIDQYTKATKP